MNCNRVLQLECNRDFTQLFIVVCVIFRILELSHPKISLGLRVLGFRQPPSRQIAGLQTTPFTANSWASDNPLHGK